MKKKIAVLVLVVLIVLLGIGLVKYIEFNENYSSSNAVFVKSDSLTFLSFKLPGKIEKIFVNEGDFVKKGQLLAKLETKELELKSDSLKHQISALKNKIDSMVLQKEKLQNDIQNNLLINQNMLSKLNESIEAKKFAIEAKKSQLNKLASDYQKFKRLYLQRKVSEEKYKNVKSAYLALLNEIKADEKLLDAMKYDKKILMLKANLIKNNLKEVDRLSKAIDSANQQLKSLKSNYMLVKQNIKDSYIYSPIDGEVAKKFVNSDEVVPAGMRVLSVVNPKELYVLDLLEETKLNGIAPGCEAKIHIDALDKDFEGVVEKVLPASAATFALVPRDISSGEFTKLAQRFYVRIKFKHIPKNVLVGMSGEVEIRKCKK